MGITVEEYIAMKNPAHGEMRMVTKEEGKRAEMIGRRVGQEPARPLDQGSIPTPIASTA